MSVRKRKWRGKNGRGREQWMIHIVYTHPDGRRQEIRKVSPNRSRREAEKYEREVRAALLAGTYGKEPEKPAPTLAEFANLFMANYARVNNKHSTVLSKQAIIDNHLVPFFGRMRLDEIRLLEIERYKASRVETHKPKTINNHLTVLRRMLVVAEEWELLKTVPRIKWLKAPKPGFRFLDFDEAERLVAAFDEEPWRTMAIVALNTGLRHGELRALQWGDIDLVVGRLVVRRAIARGKIGTPKSNRSRELPLNDKAIAALKAHRHLRGEWVFCNEDGSILTRHQGKRQLSRAVVRSGIAQEDITWHDLRHTFASHLVMARAQLKAVQELLGHATIEMTMRYAHLSPNVQREAVALLDGDHSTRTAQAAAEKGKRSPRMS